MEPIPMPAFPYGEWDPLSLLFAGEDLDLTAQRVLAQQGPDQMYDGMGLEVPAEYFLADQAMMPGVCESFFADCHSLMGSSQEGSGGFCGYYAEMPVQDGHCGGTFVPDGFAGVVAGEGLCQIYDDNDAGGDVQVDQADREAAVPIGKKGQPKRKRANASSCAGEEDCVETDAPQNPKKIRKPRAPKEKGKKAVQPKKKQKLAIPNNDEAEEGNVVARQDGQTSTTCSSEEDSVSQELNNGESAQNSNDTSALNSDGKTTRAGRGAATDPQSLYARRRRERINERLKVLQSLVPNGTKVDISTMLEEAVQYVKFLQLQIKLLSSDDMWMYAPIAYNGMDIGLHQMLPRQLL